MLTQYMKSWYAKNLLCSQNARMQDYRILVTENA